MIHRGNTANGAGIPKRMLTGQSTNTHKNPCRIHICRYRKSPPCQSPASRITIVNCICGQLKSTCPIASKYSMVTDSSIAKPLLGARNRAALDRVGCSHQPQSLSFMGALVECQKKERVDSTWWKVTRPVHHSQKPELFQDIIESVSDAPRLEMFARRYRLGWYVWGNEVNSHIEIPTTHTPPPEPTQNSG